MNVLFKDPLEHPGCRRWPVGILASALLVLIVGCDVHDGSSGSLNERVSILQQEVTTQRSQLEAALQSKEVAEAEKAALQEKVKKLESDLSREKRVQGELSDRLRLSSTQLQAHQREVDQLRATDRELRAYMYARDLVEDGDLEQALQEYIGFIRDYPDSAYAQKAIATGRRIQEHLNVAPSERPGDAHRTHQDAVEQSRREHVARQWARYDEEMRVYEEQLRQYNMYGRRGNQPAPPRPPRSPRPE